MTATVRDQLKERLGITEELSRVSPVDELRLRLRAISVEALAGDPVAAAEADQLSQEIAAVQRRVELEALATTEQAARERAAAEKEAEKVRAAAARKLAKLDGQRNAKLVAIEEAIDALEWSAAEYSEFETEYDNLRKQVDPTCSRRRYMDVVLDRLARRLSRSLLPDVYLPRGGKGFEPLGGVETTTE